MANAYPFHQIMSDSVDEMMRLIKEGEDFVYDTMMPSLLALQKPEQRKAFYSTVDWDALKVRSAGLWSRMTKDSLNLDASDVAEQQKRLDEQQRLEGQQDAMFKKQIQTAAVMGLHEPGTSRTSTTAAGMDVPLGVLAAGAGPGVQ